MPTPDALRKSLDAAGSLCSCRTDLLTRFAEALAGLRQDQAARINPMLFAQRAGLDPEDALDLFVCGAKAGLFDMWWGMVCPLCGAVTHSVPRIDQLAQDRFYCAFCDKDAVSQLDDTVEVFFCLAPNLADAPFDPLRDFPTYLRHLIAESYPLFSDWAGYHARNTAASARIEPRQTATLEFTARPGVLYRLVCLENHASIAMQAGDGEHSGSTQETSLTLESGGLSGRRLELSPGPVRILLTNATGGVEWATVLMRNAPEIQDIFKHGLPAFGPRLSAARLLGNQMFRDLFGIQALIPDLKLKMRGITLLFTDLKGSTALYDRVGDLAAYNLVREHFDLLRAAVRANHGAVVKTMGDAVMAVFSSPPDGLRAALDMLKRMKGLRRTTGEEHVGLKVGLHFGPALTVNAGNALDYFGQTVNIAARVQALSGAGEICMTSEMLEYPGVIRELEGKGWREARENAALKGVSGLTEVIRFSPPE